MGSPAILKIDVVTDASRAKAGLATVSSETTKTTKKVGSQFKTLGKTIGEAFAAEQVAEFFKTSFEAAESFERIQRQTEAAIESTGGAANISAKQVDTLSRKLEGVDGVSHDVIESAANVILRFTGIKNAVGKGNDVFNQLLSITPDVATALGQAVPKTAKTLAKALNDPIKGLAQLAKVGVTFTAQQKAQIVAMVKSGNAMGAQKIELDALKKRYGGTAAANATATDKLKNTFHDLEEDIGTVVIPIVTKIASVLDQDVVPAFKSTVSWVKSNATAVKVLAVAIGSIVIGWKLWTLAQKAWAVVTAAATVVQTAFNAVMDANPVTIVIIAIAALAAGLVIAYKKSQTFRAIIAAVWKYVKGEFVVAKTVVLAVVHALEAAWSALSTGARAAFGAVRTAVSWVGSAISNAWDAVKSFGGKLLGFIENIPGKIAGFGKAMLHAGEAFIGQLWTGIKDAAKAVGGFAADVGKSIVNAMIGFINKIIIDPIKNFHFTIGALGYHHTFQPFGSLPEIPMLGAATPQSDPWGVMSSPVYVESNPSIQVFIGQRELEDISTTVFNRELSRHGQRARAGVR